jgi:hypothetical protein
VSWRAGFTTTSYRPVVGLPIVVRPRYAKPRERMVTRVVGLSHNIPIKVHNHTLGNVLRGLTERVYRVEGTNGDLVEPPRPAAGVFETRLRKFKTQLLRKLGHCNPWTTEQLVESYQGSKRQRVQDAVDSLSSRALEERDAWLDTFVKVEAILKADPAPRVIQPRTARFNVGVGVYLKPLEKRVYAAVQRIYRSPTVMKGYNADEVGSILATKWGKFEHPVAVGLDASRFDQHVSVQALRWEHGVYNSVYRSSQLRWMLGLQVNNRGRAVTPEGTVLYRVAGCRMSGDMNTSLGNCLLMCAMVHAYAEERGIKVELANNGDDCVIILEGKDEVAFTRGLREWFLEMGFNMKVEPTAHCMEEIEFCQMRPVWNGEQYSMCRSPFNGLAKDTLCKRPMAGRLGLVGETAAWARSVGLCGIRAMGGMPMVQNAYAAMTRASSSESREFTTIQSGLRSMVGTLRKEFRVPSCDTRVSFYKAWGVMPDQQVMFEQACSRWVYVPQLISGTEGDHLSIPNTSEFN